MTKHIHFDLIHCSQSLVVCKDATVHFCNIVMTVCTIKSLYLHNPACSWNTFYNFMLNFLASLGPSRPDGPLWIWVCRSVGLDLLGAMLSGGPGFHVEGCILEHCVHWLALRIHVGVGFGLPLAPFLYTALWRTWGVPPCLSGAGWISGSGSMKWPWSHTLWASQYLKSLTFLLSFSWPRLELFYLSHGDGAPGCGLGHPSQPSLKLPPLCSCLSSMPAWVLGDGHLPVLDRCRECGLRIQAAATPPTPNW